MIQIKFKQKLNNQIHRKNGPYLFDDTGFKVWRLNGKRHRIGGPAIIYSCGKELYFLNGKRHKKNEYYKKLKEL